LLTINEFRLDVGRSQRKMGSASVLSSCLDSRCN
jgi:hypothetical protein